jgi:hypothetical protein
MYKNKKDRHEYSYIYYPTYRIAVHEEAHFWFHREKEEQP